MSGQIARTVFGLPRQIWDFFRIYYVVSAVTTFALGASAVFLPDPWRWGVVVSMAFALVLVHLARQWAAVRFNRQLRRVSYEVCIICGYSLHGLPERSICPECGYEFYKAQLGRLWKTALLGPASLGPPEHLQSKFLRSRHLFPTPLGVPRQIWKHGGWAVAIALLALAGLVASPHASREWESRILGFAPLLILAVMVVYFISCARLNRRLAGFNYEICILCGRLLSNVPQHEMCPDCGFVYDKALLSEQWRFWLLGAR